MMTTSEIHAYLLAELALEQSRLQCGLPNNYAYLYRICNDLGLFDSCPPAVRAAAYSLLDFTGCIAEM